MKVTDTKIMYADALKSMKGLTVAFAIILGTCCCSLFIMIAKLIF